MSLNNLIRKQYDSLHFDSPKWWDKKNSPSMTDKQETDYINYPINTRVKVKETGECGDAFESIFGCISVFLDSQDKAVLFKMEEVEFCENLNQ